MTVSRHHLKFVVLCLVWGLTWIAVKTGVEAVPPSLFAATRFIAAGLVMLAWAGRGKSLESFSPDNLIRLLIVSLLMIALCYGPLFWGMKFVSSGTSAVVEMSLTPLALLAFGVLAGEERWNAVGAGAMMLGIAGLCILFMPALRQAGSEGQSMLGLLAIAWAAISSAWGSVMARPLVSLYGSAFLSGATMLIGGCILLVWSLVSEPDALLAMTGLGAWHPGSSVIGAWLFLVIFGSLLGYRYYVQLLRDIGPAKAGSFAFVSPAIAVVVGAFLAGESVSLRSLLGMSLMLIAAATSLFADTITSDLRKTSRTPPTS